MSSSKQDGQFREEFAKSLVEALQERGEPSKEDLVHDAYVALCHDDPHIVSDDACRQLASALTKDDSPYRLSERLIEGIRQATGRTVVNRALDVSPKEEDDSKNDEELVWRTGGVATAAGYAALAVVCFVKIPLRCCQSSDMTIVKDCLGSYRGPKRKQEHDAESDSRVTEWPIHDHGVTAFAKELPAIAQQDSDDSSVEKKEDEISVEEVWAAEPDPSDFEYESGYDPQQALKELDQWIEAFDPVALSRSPPFTDWDDLRQAVANLLSELSYSKLAPLSKQQWRSLRVSDLLSQLTLTLLIQPENASTALLDEELQKLGIRSLFVLRDRVVSDLGVLDEYLTLVQTLIAVDAAAATPTPSSSLAPATAVGLGALSALCHISHHGNNPDAPQRIRRCILETSEDLAHVIEKLRVDSPMHITWTLLSLLDRLTNIRPDGTLWESSPLTNEDAQLLLQSGMFRELLLLIKEESAARTQLLRSLQIMCVQSPSLLGKYSWRVPDLARIVQTYEFTHEHVVDGLVWNLLGTSLAGGAVRLQLKNVPVVSVEQCRERSMNNFERLCKDAEKAMEAIQSLRTGSDAENDGWKEPIQEFSRFSNYLVSCPSLAVLWRNVATSDEITLDHVKSAVGSLRNVLSTLPRIPASPKREHRTEKSADNDKAGDPSEHPKVYGEHEEASVRKALKILSVSWQSPSRQGRENLSSKTD